MSYDKEWSRQNRYHGRLAGSFELLACSNSFLVAIRMIRTLCAISLQSSWVCHKITSLLGLVDQDEWNNIGGTHQEEWEKIKEEYWETVNGIYAKIREFYTDRKEQQAQNSLRNLVESRLRVFLRGSSTGLVGSRIAP